MRTHRLTPLVAALALLAAGCPEKKKCPAGETSCGGVCFDLQQDRRSCGTCLRVCPSGATCTAGACVCPAGTVKCGSACVDLASDAANCGSCGHACGAGTCNGAGVCACTPPAVSCGAGASPECVDTTADERNCGACGNLCKAGATCAGSPGTCQCLDPKPDDCGSLCTDLTADATHCGACDLPCTKAGMTCTASTCGCPPPTTECSTTCADLATDEGNCGSCGRSCGATQTCASGNCACPAGQTACGSGATATCDDLASDATSCGACGHACVADQSCSGGACTCAAGKVACPKVSGNEDLCCGTSGCQTAHSNGLGQTYLVDCTPPGQHTLEQARLAAKAWRPAGTTFETGLQCGSCLCQQGANEAAVWCYSGSSVAGFVRVTASPNCLAAACPLPGGIPWN